MHRDQAFGRKPSCMNLNALYVGMALLAGILLATQSAINSQLAKGLGGAPIFAALFSFLVGSLCLLVVAAAKGQLAAPWAQLPQQAPWQLIGGALGAFLVFSSVFLAPKIGLAHMLLWIILGQLIAGMIIDHWGLLQMPVRPVSLWRLLGIGIVGFGVLVFFFAEQWFPS